MSGYLPRDNAVGEAQIEQGGRELREVELEAQNDLQRVHELSIQEPLLI